MRFMILSLALVATGYRTCKSGGNVASDTIQLWVASQKVDCQGVAPQTCYLVKEKPDVDWEYFYGEIEGFDYQPGYQYELRIKKTGVANPPADASTFRYTVVDVVRKEPDPNLRLHDIWALETIGGEAVPTEWQRPNLELYPTEDKVLGFAGCSEWQGTLKMEGEKLAFTQLVVAKRDCPASEWENRFLTILERVGRYEIEGLQLSLYQGKVLLLVFRKVD